MDKSERQRLKQLAIDTIIKSSVHSAKAKLAEALEQCVNELEQVDQAPHCPTCHCHHRDGAPTWDD